MKIQKTAGGTGIGNYRRGEVLTDIGAVEPGQLLVYESIAFKATNLIKVTQSFDDKFYAVFVAPDNPAEKRQASDEEFVVNDTDLTKGEYYIALEPAPTQAAPEVEPAPDGGATEPAETAVPEAPAPAEEAVEEVVEEKTTAAALKTAQEEDKDELKELLREFRTEYPITVDAIWYFFYNEKEGNIFNDLAYRKSHDAPSPEKADKLYTTANQDLLDSEFAITALKDTEEDREWFKDFLDNQEQKFNTILEEAVDEEQFDDEEETVAASKKIAGVVVKGHGFEPGIEVDIIIDYSGSVLSDVDVKEGLDEDQPWYLVLVGAGFDALRVLVQADHDSQADEAVETHLIETEWASDPENIEIRKTEKVSVSDIAIVNDPAEAPQITVGEYTWYLKPMDEYHFKYGLNPDDIGNVTHVAQFAAENQQLRQDLIEWLGGRADISGKTYKSASKKTAGVVVKGHGFEPGTEFWGAMEKEEKLGPWIERVLSTMRLMISQPTQRKNTYENTYENTYDLISEAMRSVGVPDALYDDVYTQVQKPAFKEGLTGSKKVAAMEKPDGDIVYEGVQYQVIEVLPEGMEAKAPTQQELEGLGQQRLPLASKKTAAAYDADEAYYLVWDVDGYEEEEFDSKDKAIEWVDANDTWGEPNLSEDDLAKAIDEKIANNNEGLPEGFKIALNQDRLADYLELTIPSQYWKNPDATYPVTIIEVKEDPESITSFRERGEQSDLALANRLDTESRAYDSSYADLWWQLQTLNDFEGGQSWDEWVESILYGVGQDLEDSEKVGELLMGKTASIKDAITSPVRTQTDYGEQPAAAQQRIDAINKKQESLRQGAYGYELYAVKTPDGKYVSSTDTGYELLDDVQKAVIGTNNEAYRLLAVTRHLHGGNAAIVELELDPDTFNYYKEKVSAKGVVAEFDLAKQLRKSARTHLRKYGFELGNITQGHFNLVAADGSYRIDGSFTSYPFPAGARNQIIYTISDKQQDLLTDVIEGPNAGAMVDDMMARIAQELVPDVEASLKTAAYQSLNDAADETVTKGLGEGSTSIYYMRPETLRDMGMGGEWLKDNIDNAAVPSTPTPETIDSTHVLLGEIQETDPEQIFGLLQAEVWSPAGEAKDLIRNKGLNHTSMSVGDVVEINGEFFMVDTTGFSKLNIKKSAGDQQPPLFSGEGVGGSEEPAAAMEPNPDNPSTMDESGYSAYGRYKDGVKIAGTAQGVIDELEAALGGNASFWYDNASDVYNVYDEDRDANVGILSVGDGNIKFLNGGDDVEADFAKNFNKKDLSVTEAVSAIRELLKAPVVDEEEGESEYELVAVGNPDADEIMEEKGNNFDDDIVINDNEMTAFYAGKPIAEAGAGEYDKLASDIHEWMEREQYWPGVFIQRERGIVDPYTIQKKGAIDNFDAPVLREHRYSIGGSKTSFGSVVLNSAPGGLGDDGSAYDMDVGRNSSGVNEEEVLAVVDEYFTGKAMAAAELGDFVGFVGDAYGVPKSAGAEFEEAWTNEDRQVLAGLVKKHATRNDFIS